MFGRIPQLPDISEYLQSVKSEPNPTRQSKNKRVIYYLPRSCVQANIGTMPCRRFSAGKSRRWKLLEYVEQSAAHSERRLSVGQGVEKGSGQPGEPVARRFDVMGVGQPLRAAPALASIAFLARSNTALKPSGLAIASSERDLRSKQIPAALSPSMKRE